MKYAVIIPDGAADEPLDALGGRTPLEAADTPNLDAVAAAGTLGLVSNIPRDLPPGSDVAIMSVLGYDPGQYYTGRAPLEAAAMGIDLAPDQWAVRCNLVTISDGRMIDYAAGHISTEEAAALIEELNRHLGGQKVVFHAGVGYRHVMVFTGELDAQTTPPHDILDKPVDAHYPTGRGADTLCTLMLRSEQVLCDHPVNQVRRDLGENPATAIWLWGQGTRPAMPPFAQRFGCRGAVVTAVDLVRGLGALVGMRRIDVKGATGYLDTNYAGKGKAAVRSIRGRRDDLVVVHVEAPDECGHAADVAGKVKAIEQIDRHVVGPVAEALAGLQGGGRILVLPDHPTPVPVRSHTRDPVPFAMAGAGIEPCGATAFSEAAARRTGLLVKRGCDLMGQFVVRG